METTDTDTRQSRRLSVIVFGTLLTFGAFIEFGQRYDAAALEQLKQARAHEPQIIDAIQDDGFTVDRRNIRITQDQVQGELHTNTCTVERFIARILRNKSYQVTDVYDYSTTTSEEHFQVLGEPQPLTFQTAPDLSGTDAKNFCPANQE